MDETKREELARTLWEAAEETSTIPMGWEEIKALASTGRGDYAETVEYWRHIAAALLSSVEVAEHLAREAARDEMAEAFAKETALILSHSTERLRRLTEIADELNGLMDSLDEHVTHDDIYSALLALFHTAKGSGGLPRPVSLLAIKAALEDAVAPTTLHPRTRLGYMERRLRAVLEQLG